MLSPITKDVGFIHVYTRSLKVVWIIVILLSPNDLSFMTFFVSVYSNDISELLESASSTLSLID